MSIKLKCWRLWVTKQPLIGQLPDSGDCTLKQALALAQQHIDSGTARLDAELLLLAVLKQSRVYLYSHSEEKLARRDLDEFCRLLARRSKGEPVAHILQCREFWSLPFKVTSDTLIPRPETEKLVELALQLALPEQAKVLDLGAGTGAIACALAAEKKQWSVLAVEQSEAALAVLSDNVKNLALRNVSILQSDWFQAISPQSFDLIVSNPPYIAGDDPHLEQGDLRFEPRAALVSGSDGLTAMRHITEVSPRYLNSGGWLLLEHGYNQGCAVHSLMLEAGFAGVELCLDWSGHQRVTMGRWRREISK